MISATAKLLKIWIVLYVPNLNRKDYNLCYLKIILKILYQKVKMW